LMNKYPEIQGYCDRVLYPTKECWAYAFTKQKFSANTHSTQQVKSINHVIKLEANSGNFLCQLQARIELQLKDEAKYASLQKFRNMNPTRRFIKDNYEEPQVLLDMALENCARSNVNEIWEVKHIQSITNHSQFILLLDDGTYYCTCLYLVYAGFVYWHFFAVMIQSKKVFFNIRLIPSHWFSEGLAMFDNDQESSIQIIQNENKPPTGTFQVLERIHGQEVISRVAVELESKKVFYSRGLGLCKKALNIAITNNSNKALENLLQQFIDEQILSQCQNTYESSVQKLDQKTNDFKIQTHFNIR
ncbi:35573_t:CDS:2, partial [Racocetra persica]